MVLLPYSEGMHISKKITDEAVRAKLRIGSALCTGRLWVYSFVLQRLRLVLTKSVVIWSIYGVHGKHVLKRFKVS